MKNTQIIVIGSRTGRLLIAFAAMTLAGTVWAEQHEVKLRTNPFVRPALMNNAPQPTPASGPVRSNAPPSHLRFALAAGPDSIVNVDGRTLRIGDEINGYRLEAVKADTAVFSNGEQVIELKMPLKDIRNTR